MNNVNTSKVKTDCKFCRALNDGLCGNYCSLDKSQRNALVSANRHLFNIDIKVKTPK